MKLNESQEQIVFHRGSSIVVQASPGSGKTTTIVERAKTIQHEKETP